LHHGKTSLMDMLVQQTHAIGGLAGKNTNETQTRYCDNRLDEQVGLHVFPNISG
jgi:translation elongation factor EF-G